MAEKESTAQMVIGLFEDLLPILVIGGIIYGIYYVITWPMREAKKAASGVFGFVKHLI